VLEELALLIRLQEIDIELANIEAEKGDLPEQIEKLEDQIDYFQSRMDEIKTDIEKINNERVDQSLIVEAAHENLKKSQSVIFNVKTTREYDAISSEIEQSKKMISESERQQLESMANEEDLQKSFDEMQSELDKVNNELNERRSEMDERLESTQEEELSFCHKREKIIGQLKKPVYDHYERIKKLRDGYGISYLTDGACGYCFSRIPPQRQAEIRRMDDIILCEVCGCIIVNKQD